jgi:Domain of unknown function (DUF4276)
MNPTVIEILTEEQSMVFFLRELLPLILPTEYQVDVNCFIRSHEGKTDLLRSVPRKLRAYPNFGYPVKLMIIHDQDANDCKILKAKILSLCKKQKTVPVVVRIACKELENWYLGDLKAIESLYPRSKASLLISKSKYRVPDDLNGFEEISSLTNDFSKTRAAREIVQYMDIKNNRSKSFNQFILGLEKLLKM